MPAAVPVVAAVAGAAASYGVSTSLTVFAFGSFYTGLGGAAFSALAGGLAGFTVSTAINAVGSRALSSKSKAGNPAQDARGQSVMVRNSVESHKIVYGQTRVSGAIVFISTTNSGPNSAGTNVTGDNLFLHMVIAIAGHEIEEVSTIYLNDLAVTLDGNGFVQTAPYLKDGLSYVRVRSHLGASDQAADSQLVTEYPDWTENHRLRGIAYLYVRMQWNSDIFPQGIPNVSAVVKGKKVYDPRSSTTAWTDNAALCIRDYMVSDYGFNCDDDEVNDTYFNAAANICEESVTLQEGGTQDRYTINGVLDTASARLDNLNALVAAMAGTVTYVQGQFRAYAGAYDAPVGSIDLNMLAGPIEIRARPNRQEVFNRVQGTYVDPNKSWQPTDFPAVTNGTYETQDGGEVIPKDIVLTLTNHPEAAQRIGKVILEQGRQGIQVKLPLNHEALSFAVWDTVTFTNAPVGWSSKVFRIKKLSTAGISPITLHLQEESSSSYSWASNEASALDAAPDTNLPSPFNVGEPQGVGASSGNAELFIAGDGTVVSRIRLSWAASTNVFVTDGGSVEAQFKKTADTVWQDSQPLLGSATQTFLSPVDDGTSYDLRVRFKTSLGYASPWTQIPPHTVVGKTALPTDVTVFTIEGSRLSWTPVTDADLAGYRIRYQPGTLISWGDSIPMHDGLVTETPFEMLVMPAGTTTIMIKAVDTSGNESQNPAIIVTDLGDPEVANIVETFDRKAAGWPGTLTNGTVDGSADLVADAINLMWNVDEGSAMWSTVSTSLMWATSTYEQMTYEDRITVSAALAGSKMTLDYAITGDPWSVQYRENSAELMWSLEDATAMWSTDDSTLTWDLPEWLPWPGEVIAKNSLYDFLITTGQGLTQGVVSSFSIVIDAPDIDESMNDVAVSAGGTRLTLTKTYQVIQNVQLTLQTDGGTAVTARYEDKDATLGPLVKCFNSAGTAVSGTLDARIKGY